jgi:hypothetical protein
MVFLQFWLQSVVIRRFRVCLRNICSITPPESLLQSEGFLGHDLKHAGGLHGDSALHHHADATKVTPVWRNSHVAGEHAVRVEKRRCVYILVCISCLVKDRCLKGTLRPFRCCFANLVSFASELVASRVYENFHNLFLARQDEPRVSRLCVTRQS